MNIQDIFVKIQHVVEGKRKWRAHLARVKALPQDYQIVYQEIQAYLFKGGFGDLTDGTDLLSGIVDLFEEGAARGKRVLEVTGSDVAGFCDDLARGSNGSADFLQESVDQEVSRAMKKLTGKTK